MDEYRSRPGDEFVEPLFAGLGVSEDQTRSAPPGRRRLIPWLLAVGVGLVVWWLV